MVREPARLTTNTLEIFRNFKIPSLRNSVIASEAKQSRSKFRLKFPKPRVIPRLDRGILSQINLEFNIEIRDPRVKPEDDKESQVGG